MEPNPNALAVASPTNALVPFEPSGIDQAIQLCERVSKSGLLPPSLVGKPNDVLVLFMQGRDLGLTMMQSLTSINVIEGRPSLSAKLKIALARKSPLCKYFKCVETTDKIAVWVTHREGNDPMRLRFTLEDAIRAGLVHTTKTGAPGMWQKWPAQMLRKTCGAQLADLEYGDVLLALADEIESVGREENTDEAPSADSVIEGQVVPQAQQATQAAPQRAVPVTPAPPPMAEVPWDTKPALADLRKRINAAGSLSELEALVPELAAIPREQKGDLRETYKARKVALSAAAVPATQALDEVFKARTAEEHAKVEAQRAVAQAAAVAESAPEREPGSEG